MMTRQLTFLITLTLIWASLSWGLVQHNQPVTKQHNDIPKEAFMQAFKERVEKRKREKQQTLEQDKNIEQE